MDMEVLNILKLLVVFVFIIRFGFNVWIDVYVIREVVIVLILLIFRMW